MYKASLAALIVKVNPASVVNNMKIVYNIVI